MKKKVVFFSTPAYGHMLPELPVIKRLISKGYTVKCYSSGHFKKMIEETGATFVEYQIDFNQYKLDQVVDNFLTLTEALVAINEKAYSIYSQKIDSDTDLILYDSMCSFAKNIAYKKGIKSVCFVATLCYNWPVFMCYNMFWSSSRLLFNHFNKFYSLFRAEKKFRKENHLPKFKLIDFFVNCGDETIVFSPKEFQPLAFTFNKTFHFVGTTIKERKENQTANYNNYDIYISLGTVFKNNTELLNNLIKHREIRDKKVVVVTDRDDLPVRNNLDQFSYVDQLNLLSQCNLFINHGGLNTVYEAIYSNVRQIAIPFQEEQRLDAIMLQKRKIGAYVRRYSDKTIANKIKNIDRYCKNLDKYSKILHAYDGTTLAYDIIEKCLIK